VSVGVRHDTYADATDGATAAVGEAEPLSLLAPHTPAHVQAPALPRSVWTAIAVPILGHTSWAYCTAVRPLGRHAAGAGYPTDAGEWGAAGTSTHCSLLAVWGDG
jgi:hypothetical protein